MKTTLVGSYGGMHIRGVSLRRFLVGEENSVRNVMKRISEVKEIRSRRL
jgi:hypothetical protein